MSVSELSDEDFVSGEFIHTDLSKGDRLAYICDKAVKSCVITAQTHDGTRTAKCTLCIKGEVTKLELKTDNGITGGDGSYTVHLKPGAKLKLQTILEADYGANTKLIWKSDAASVATVSNGKVSVKAKPEYDCCLITASTADGSASVSLKIYIDR